MGFAQLYKAILFLMVMSCSPMQLQLQLCRAVSKLAHDAAFPVQSLGPNGLLSAQHMYINYKTVQSKLSPCLLPSSGE